MVLEFEPHRGDIVKLFAKTSNKIIKMSTLLRAPINSVGRKALFDTSPTRGERAAVFSR